MSPPLINPSTSVSQKIGLSARSLDNTIKLTYWITYQTKLELGCMQVCRNMPILIPPPPFTLLLSEVLCPYVWGLSFVVFCSFCLSNLCLICSIFTVQILYIGTDMSQQTVQTKIRLLLKKQSDQGLRCLPFHQHLLDALMQCIYQTFLLLGQLWQLFEVSLILEFLR